MGGVCEKSSTGDVVIQVHIASCADCTPADVQLGLQTGSMMTVEEVRLEWLPLSTSTIQYIPPVARFYVKHYR